MRIATRYTVRVLSPLCLVLATVAGPAHGEIVEASDTHYRLSHRASASSRPSVLWDRLIHPERWWNPAHSYSGQAENLHLDARAGGLWREEWDGGSVAHGTVLLVVEGKPLRMEAPFGPLQGLGAYVVWTVTIEPEGSGSVVTFDEIASAPTGSSLQEIARAVDTVKGEAIKRLTGD